MFAPNATVTFDKNNDVINGVLEATDINFSFNNAGINDTGTGINIGSSISTILYAQ